MKKAACHAVVALTAAFLLSFCHKPAEPDNVFTFHFQYINGKYAEIKILEDVDPLNDPRFLNAAKYYCYLEEGRRMFIYTPLDIDDSFFRPLTMHEEIRGWSITPYIGNQKHYQGDRVIQVWFDSVVDRRMFDFMFQLRFRS